MSDARHALAVAKATALHRSQAAPWYELYRGAQAIEWLAFPRPDEHGYVEPLSDDLSDADAATECALLIEAVRCDGKRGEIVTRLLELTDAAVRALGGKLAVKS